MIHRRARAGLAACRHIAIEGGGALARAYLPVYTEIERTGALQRIRTAAGTSAGAATAVAIACRTPASVLKSPGANPSARSLLRPETLIGSRWGAGNVLRFVLTRGLFSRSGLDAWAENFVRLCGGQGDLTFSDVVERYGCQLLIPATDILRAHRPDVVVVFSPETTPDTRVADALAASMCLPFVWPPPRIQVAGRGAAPRPLWDGGLHVNHPLHLLASHPDHEVVGLRLDTRYEVAGELPPELDDDFRSWVWGLVSGLRAKANDAYVDRWHRCIRVVPPDGVLVVSFDRTPAQEAALEAAGLAALEEWGRRLEAANHARDTAPETL